MDLFDKVRERTSAAGQLPRLSSADINALKKRRPKLPADYLRFLVEVGYGDLGELQLYCGPSAAASFYPATSESLKNVIIFGDDKQGYCFGFDTSDFCRVVEVSPRAEVAKDIEPDFTSLLQGYFGGDSSSAFHTSGKN
jgi:hypothetical protein